MHIPPLIHDLAVILATAGLVTFLFRRIHQPVVLGYVLAGFLIGPYTPPHSLITDLPSVQTWSELGVIFLMFALGLEFSFQKLARVGGVAAGTALIEVVSMLGLGFLAGKALGWNYTDSLFLGGILSVSSTTIILKAFEELGLKNRRFAEIVFGVLIVEDLVAILLLVGLSTVAISQTFFSWDLVYAAGKLAFVVSSWFVVGYFVIPSFLRYAGRHMDDDTMTVFACGLCLTLVVVATHFNYSAALGAFIMGSIIAESQEAHRIEALIRPLKGLFAAVFFVSVGMLVDLQIISTHWKTIAVLTTVTIAGKLLTSTLGALLFGQSLKNSVRIGFSLAQIGEFSFIIAALGIHLKVTSDFLYPIAVAVSAITTFSTPYLIRVSGWFAQKLEEILPSHFLSSLQAHSAHIHRTSHSTDQRKQTLRQALTFLVNTTVASLAFLFLSQIDFLKSHPLLGWAVALLLGAPFIWGMLFAFKGHHRVTPLLAWIFTIAWLGVMSERYFRSPLTRVGTFVAAGTLFLLFYRRLEVTYRWLERRFVSTFDEKAEQDEEPMLRNLAPWDLHLVKLAVHPNSACVGKTLQQLDVRNRYGINIVVIQRGHKNISPPQSEDALLPHDCLLVLGGDEQIEFFANHLNGSAQEATGEPLSQFNLRRLSVASDSELLGKAIRDSGIREKMQSTVVGLERASQRLLNPSPSLILERGDILWLVGTA